MLAILALVGAWQAASGFFDANCITHLSNVKHVLAMLWAKHDSFWPFWHLMVPCKQLEAISAHSAPRSVMSELLGHDVGQT
jgi:hypothetical protein